MEFPVFLIIFARKNKQFQLLSVVNTYLYHDNN